MLSGRKIVLGVTGGIACYKTCEIISRLRKLGAETHVIMTRNSANFVTPLTFEAMSGNPVVTDTFERAKTWEIEHVSLAQKAELFVIAPATANIIGKIAGGIADDMLSTTIMATRAKVLVCPAMNMAMYENAIYQENEKKLRNNAQFEILAPTVGRLACGDTGVGKMAEPEDIVAKIIELLMPKRDLEGKNVLITCGSTEEPIDKVRVITNHSSGKMGMSIASECVSRGAHVTLIQGHIAIPTASGIAKVTTVNTTDEMYKATLDNLKGNDYIIMAAAPSDYKVDKVALNKIKAEKLTLNLIKNPDIAKAVGEAKGESKLIIFSAETEDLEANAKGKLVKKNADMVVANDVTKEGAGFMVDTNIVSIITRDGIAKSYEKMQKTQVAKIIVDTMIEL